MSTEQDITDGGRDRFQKIPRGDDSDGGTATFCQHNLFTFRSRGYACGCIAVDISRQERSPDHSCFQEARLLPPSEGFQLQGFLSFMGRKSRAAYCSSEDAQGRRCSCLFVRHRLDVGRVIHDDRELFSE